MKDLNMQCVDQRRIADYPDYAITTDGKVISYRTNSSGVYLSPYHIRGYLKVSLCNDHGQKCKFVHRLVAEAFIPNPLNLPQVNHINGNKDDCRVSNLEWVSCSENILHAYRVLGKKSSVVGLHCSRRPKLNKEQVLLIRQSPMSARQLAKQFGVTAATVCNVRNGKTYAKLTDDSA